MSVLNINRGNAPTNPVYIQLSAGIIQPARTVTAATDTATIADYLILDDATGGAITQKLPAGLSSVQTMLLVLKKADASANVVTIDANGSTIDGAATLGLYTQGASVTLQWNGAAWSIEAFNPGAWANYTPVVTASGAMTVSGVSIAGAQYLRELNKVSVSFVVSFTLGGVANNSVLITLPFASAFPHAQEFVYSVNTSGASVVLASPLLLSGGTQLICLLGGVANWPLGATAINAAGSYRV